MSEYLIDAITKDTRYVTGYANGTRFGIRNLPELGMYNNYHIGNDYNLPEGTSLYMPADGEFVATCRDGYGNGYGNYILAYLPQESGGITIHLSHLSHIEWYEGKGIIKKGTYIGNSGNTGKSSGPHLHLGVAPGVKKNTIKGTYGDGTWINPSSVMIEGTPVASEPTPAPAPAPNPKPVDDKTGKLLVIYTQYLQGNKDVIVTDINGKQIGSPIPASKDTYNRVRKYRIVKQVEDGFYQVEQYRSADPLKGNGLHIRWRTGIGFE